LETVYVMIKIRMFPLENKYVLSTIR